MGATGSRAAKRKMPISRAIDDGSAGFSLVEILVALVVLAMAASLVGISLAGRSQAWQLDRAGQTLSDDLRRARLTARTRGVPVVIEIRPGGYAIESLGLERTWPDALEARWQVIEPARVREPVRLVLPAQRFAMPRVDIQLVNPTGEIRITMDPVTGQVHHEPV